jgi:hypothetical protein
MNAFLEIFILVFAVKGTTDFKETKFYCSDVVYYWSQEGSNAVGIKAKDKEWVAKDFSDIDALKAEIDGQCKKKK